MESEKNDGEWMGKMFSRRVDVFCKVSIHEALKIVLSQRKIRASFRKYKIVFEVLFVYKKVN